MKTCVEIDGKDFLINGHPTYEGRTFNGRSVQGLLFNSRMIQAIFDDENDLTRGLWSYPDTHVWDTNRNTREFCEALPEYRRHGLLAVTVGLQGGGSVYSPQVYGQYLCSAYNSRGELKKAYFDRLSTVLAAADACGMLVIINYFYWRQAIRLESDNVIRNVTRKVTEWLLSTGRQNVIVDLMNEVGHGWKMPIFSPENIHELIDLVKGTSINGRRLLLGSSGGGGKAIPFGKWADLEDFSMPHGNGCAPEQLRAKLVAFKQSDEYQKRPRPVVVNEDSVFIENLDAAFQEGCSWGFYCQGYGSAYKDRFDWTARAREKDFALLSGYQTLPVNWGINTDIQSSTFEL